MATPLDSMFMTGFSQGAGIVNNAQQNAYNFAGRVMQQRQLAQEDALAPLRAQQMDAQIKIAAANLETHQWLAEDRVKTAQAEPELAKALATGDMDQAWNVVAQNPTLAQSALWKEAIARQDLKQRLDVQKQVHTETMEMWKTRAEEARIGRENVAQINADSRLSAVKERNQALIELQKNKVLSAAGRDPSYRFELKGLDTELELYKESPEALHATPEQVKARVSQIVEEHKARANTPTAAKSTAGGLPSPRTQEEFDALPAGTEFINPADGRRYRKK